MKKLTLTITVTSFDATKPGTLDIDGEICATRFEKMAIMQHIAEALHLTGADVAAVAIRITENAKSEKDD